MNSSDNLWLAQRLMRSGDYPGVVRVCERMPDSKDAQILKFRALAAAAWRPENEPPETTAADILMSVVPTKKTNNTTGRPTTALPLAAGVSRCGGPPPASAAGAGARGRTAALRTASRAGTARAASSLRRTGTTARVATSAAAVAAVTNPASIDTSVITRSPALTLAVLEWLDHAAPAPEVTLRLSQELNSTPAAAVVANYRAARVHAVNADVAAAAACVTAGTVNAGMQRFDLTSAHAGALVAAGRTEEAVQMLEQVPGRHFAQKLICSSLCYDPELAFSYLRDASEQNPVSPQVLAEVGAALFASGRFHASFLVYRRCAQCTQSPEALASAALAAAAAGHDTAAARLARAALGRPTTTTQVNDIVGRVLRMLGESEVGATISGPAPASVVPVAAPAGGWGSLVDGALIAGHQLEHEESNPTDGNRVRAALHGALDVSAINAAATLAVTGTPLERVSATEIDDLVRFMLSI